MRKSDVDSTCVDSHCHFWKFSESLTLSLCFHGDRFGLFLEFCEDFDLEFVKNLELLERLELLLVLR